MAFNGTDVELCNFAGRYIMLRESSIVMAYPASLVEYCLIFAVEGPIGHSRDRNSFLVDQE